MELTTSVGLSVYNEQVAVEFSGAFDEDGKGTAIMYVRPVKEFTTGLYLHMDREMAQTIHGYLGRILAGESLTAEMLGAETVNQPNFGGLNDVRDVDHTQDVVESDSENQSQQPE